MAEKIYANIGEILIDNITTINDEELK